MIEVEETLPPHLAALRSAYYNWSQVGYANAWESVYAVAKAVSAQPAPQGDVIERAMKAVELFTCDVSLRPEHWRGIVLAIHHVIAPEARAEGYRQGVEDATVPVQTDEALRHRYAVPDLGPGTGTAGCYAFSQNDVDALLAVRRTRLLAPAEKTLEQKVTDIFGAYRQCTISEKEALSGIMALLGKEAK
jgi:hypothetical protein